MADWQPFETAPKDGTKILVFTVHGDFELTEWYEAKHSVYEEVEGGLFRRKEETYARGWNGNAPTHWMPLPAPPVDAEEAAERLRATWKD